jgi:hypothetical protein
MKLSTNNSATESDAVQYTQARNSLVQQVNIVAVHLQWAQCSISYREFITEQSMQIGRPIGFVDTLVQIEQLVDKYTCTGSHGIDVVILVGICSDVVIEVHVLSLLKLNEYISFVYSCTSKSLL